MEKLAINVDEFAAMVGIGRSKAFELSRRDDFPSVHLGRRIVIPMDALKEWLAKEANVIDHLRK